MSLLKSISRKIIFPSIISLGIENFLSKKYKSDKVILMYHGVVPNPDFGISVNHISTTEFEKHLRYISSKFIVCSLQNLLTNEILDTPKPKIAITFDDGYANNYQFAYPLLRKYNIPATIFVVSNCIDNPNSILWYDKVDLYKSDIDINNLKSHSINLKADLLTSLQNCKSISELKSILKKLDGFEKDIILDAVIVANPELEKKHEYLVKLLTIDQIKEMSNSGLIEIGSHTHSHPNLDMLNDNQLNNELSKSKQLLEETIQSEVSSIAFPDGAYNAFVKAKCLSVGYKNLFAVDYRLDEDKFDKSIRQRFCISNTTTMESNMIRLHKDWSTLKF